MLSNSAIDQHMNTRGREHDLVTVIEKHQWGTKTSGAGLLSSKDDPNAASNL